VGIRQCVFNLVVHEGGRVWFRSNWTSIDRLRLRDRKSKLLEVIVSLLFAFNLECYLTCAKSLLALLQLFQKAEVSGHFCTHGCGMCALSAGNSLSE